MNTRFLILVFGICVMGYLSAEEYSYRLSGIIAPEFGDAIAIIEVADGSEEMFKEGDPIGNGYIESINKQSVKLVFDDDEQLLYLAGVDFDSSEIEQPPSPLNDMISPEIIFKIADMSEKHSNQDKPIIGIALNAALGLPQEAKITSVNEQNVDSTHRILQKIIRVLSEKEPLPLSFSISGVEGMDRIYRFPIIDEQPIQ